MKKILLVIIAIVIIITVVVFLFLSSRGGQGTMVEAIEEVRGARYVEYVIHEDYLLDGAFIFYLKNMNNDSLVLSGEYVKKMLNGKWKWVNGGGHSGTHLSLPHDYDGRSIPFSHQYMRVVEDKQHKIPFPIVFGGISDPSITRLVVRDTQSGLERQVKIIMVNDVFRFYYVYLSETAGYSLDIIAYNGRNEIIYRESVDQGTQTSES